ncbi:MAG: Stk1 family PASTA domain-containing Ser/Thr kinase [Lachnospiraceae bacterium]|nr:Stk1 family PASTA domain-containing Ser/Thr kinase [Lachnospiraceae bacterium]
MIKIGMMIGERYEILEKIGTGGMSDVYKAKCHKLNRMVAVKVLKQEFSENANFVSKFRTEAQAAAGLMHPNIVNVYDVGDENGIYYIVMELVEGITLKKYIEKKARLSVKEAVTIAIQICLGIEAAHNNHIIHRDIKPQNVIISKEGKVKVTDFGIAKAATSNTITSNVMGSVHYTSPEQARGGFSDEKSDIYSLGITLFEMLTGRVPFNGDTTVAIAIKQIQEEMPSPREYVPEIPISVEQIVLKCTQKSPDRRYQSMGELINDLRRSFTNPDEDFVKIVSDDDFSQTRTMTPEEMEALKRSTKPQMEEITGELPKAVQQEDEDDDDEYDPRMNRIMTILAIVVGIIICVVAILLIGKTIGIFRLSRDNTSASDSDSTSIEVSIEQVVMPNVVDMEYLKAVDVLKKEGLLAKAKYEESSTVAEGTVISSSIHDGLKVDVGTVVELTVSAGAITEVVPDVVGKTLSAANKDIMDKNFKVDIVEEYNDNVLEGHVISQNPEGNGKAPVGSTITITVSLGSKTEVFEMPSVLGMLTEDAVVTLTEAGLVVDSNSVTQVYNDVYGEGYVCYQSIAYGTDVTKGTRVDIQVSKGKEPEVEEKYSFKGNILAPTTTEDKDYKSGDEVKITITKDDGTVLFETTTTSFPVPVNMTSITGSSKGKITLTYNVTLESTTVEDENGTVTITPGTTEERQITREVEFAKEEE